MPTRDNDDIIGRMRGVAAQPGSSDADPRNPNVEATKRKGWCTTCGDRIPDIEFANSNPFDVLSKHGRECNGSQGPQGSAACQLRRPGMRLTLKWGSVKGWDGFVEGTPARAALAKWIDKAEPGESAMMDRPDEDEKELICRIIDAVDGEIWNDWDDKVMSKDEAKAYVRDYDKRK